MSAPDWTRTLERDETGAVSQRDFDRMLDWELSRCSQDRLPLTVVAVALSRAAGPAGESTGEDAEFLRQVLRILRDQTRQGDVVGRGNRASFWLMMPDTPLEKGLFLLEDMRRLLTNSTIRLPGEPGPLKISLAAGLASFPKDGSERDVLLRKSHDALFRAGSDQVCLATDEKMVLKSNYYPRTQLARLAALAKHLDRTEASLLREALDDLFRKQGHG